jgi:hypothetical protein
MDDGGKEVPSEAGGGVEVGSHPVAASPVVSDGVRTPKAESSRNTVNDEQDGAGGGTPGGSRAPPWFQDSACFSLSCCG